MSFLVSQILFPHAVIAILSLGSEPVSNIAQYMGM
ncbi:hypothetical protein XM38_002170 [Halomicronema hongdechloris C2206]|uniref:Uncharacterized protein n=1 Tax=Halomicronema hongdechloris C2206 TaxID=1641165 RepID=A0A1Z3HG67_9CYAN|nr:hypothetical protein XM38_002170 [Halomicronema hongdechloris C2206]